jgi:molybdopterin/thiamine biosynthesis adenylyltransferase
MGGSVQAAEAIKVLTGLGDPLLSRMFLFDLGTMEFELIELERKRGCSSCGGIQ